MIGNPDWEVSARASYSKSREAEHMGVQLTEDGLAFRTSRKQICRLLGGLNDLKFYQLGEF